MRKSTHQGHCQACGRLQMLPDGKLSKHGYTVKFGFFQGVCMGAHHAPYEESCQLIKDVILPAAIKHYNNIKAFRCRLAIKPTTPKAYVRVGYANPKGRHYSQDYRWEQVEVSFEQVPFGETGRFYIRTFAQAGSQWTRTGELVTKPTIQLNQYSYDDTDVLDFCQKLNKKYAEWLKHEEESAKRYVAWEQERVDTWKPMPLLPATHKDKEGFKPVAAPY